MLRFTLTGSQICGSRHERRAGSRPADGADEKRRRGNDLHLRTLEVAQIREDEYFGSLIADDLKGILRDIRNEHRPDAMTADKTSLVATVQGQLQDAMNFEGSSEKKKIRAYLATISLDYDALTKEEFVSLIGILKKSKYMKNPISQRGRTKLKQSHKKRR